MPKPVILGDENGNEVRESQIVAQWVGEIDYDEVEKEVLKQIGKKLKTRWVAEYELDSERYEIEIAANK